MRGRYGSEGTFSKYHDYDAPDGYDTVEWAAALPYSSGDVGMFGTSYGAHTQADAAKMNPPHLWDWRRSRPRRSGCSSDPGRTANRFKAGHRIRIDISSSNFPRFDVNPNTGEPLGRHRRASLADNSIRHEAAQPSHVVLPVVPAP